MGKIFVVSRESKKCNSVKSHTSAHIKIAAQPGSWCHPVSPAIPFNSTGVDSSYCSYFDSNSNGIVKMQKLAEKALKWVTEKKLSREKVHERYRKINLQ
jgi:hypothetical protein